MEFNIEIRKVQLENLEQFISTARSKVKTILDCLQWNEQKVFEKKPLVTCPNNPNHKLSSKTLEKHTSECSIKAEGYDLNEEFLSIPQHNPGQFVIIDNEKKFELFLHAKSKGNFISAWRGQPEPKTSDRMLTTYSSDERLALYEYAVSTTKGPSPLPDFSIVAQDEDKRDLTSEELMALERDAKRRRIKYKSVYTNHKSHTEVLREIIDSQMNLYKDWLTGKSESLPSRTDLDKDANDRSTISRNSAHSSGSKHPNKKRERSGKRSDDEEEKQRNKRRRSRSKSRRSSKSRRRSRSSRRKRSRESRNSRHSNSRNGYKPHH